MGPTTFLLTKHVKIAEKLNILVFFFPFTATERGLRVSISTKFCCVCLKSKKLKNSLLLITDFGLNPEIMLS